MLLLLLGVRCCCWMALPGSLAAVKRLTNMVSMHYYTVCLLKSFRYTVFALLSHAAAVIHRMCVVVCWAVYATLGSLTMTILLHHRHITINKPNSSKNILFTYASATHIVVNSLQCVYNRRYTSIIILLTRTNSNSTSNYTQQKFFLRCPHFALVHKIVKCAVIGRRPLCPFTGGHDDKVQPAPHM